MVSAKKNKEMAELEYKEEPMVNLYSKPFLGFLSRARVRRICKEILPIRNKKVLDVGCEEGYVCYQLSKLGCRVHGIDIVEDAVKKFRAKIGKRKIRNMSASVGAVHETGMKEGSFDALVCTEVIEHIPKLDAAFKEFSRVLKPGGKLIITYPNESVRRLLYPIARVFGLKIDIVDTVTLHEYSKKNILNKVKKNFRIEKAYSFPCILPVTRFIIAAKRGKQATGSK